MSVIGSRGATIPMPTGLVAAYTPGTDKRVSVVAVRYRATDPDNSEFLVVKDDDSMLWAGSADLDFAKVPAKE
jgi:hypothetical protein